MASLVLLPDGSRISARTDEQGRATVDLPDPGLEEGASQQMRSKLRW